MLKSVAPRIYQQTIFNSYSQKSILVVLPTGMGKTMIALMLAIQRLKNFPNSKILFLAPTKPLAEQHLNTFKKHIEMDENRFVLFTGFVAPEKRDYYKTNKLPKPVYANNAALLFYIDPNYLTKKDFYSIGLYGERATKLEELLKDQGGVFLLLDYPIIPRDSLLWDLLNKCALVKKFKSDEITMGYIFNCSSKGL